MTSTVRHVRVVVVSPGDVADERALVDDVVDELNTTIAADRGCRLSVWRWETDAWPQLHLEGPQGAIDEIMDIRGADVVVGVFWKRFGTPTHESGSGTEHELKRAWEAWNEQGSPQVMVYFCGRPHAAQSSDETAQWGRVLDFKEALPEQLLWWKYAELGEFEKLVRRHLTQFVLKLIPATPPPAPTAGRVCFNLPPAAAAFTGRTEELDAIDAALGVADRAVITQAIAGLGGVGKSQLAARYVQKRTDGFEIVAWINAEGGGTDDLARLAAKLGVPMAADTAPSDRAKLALECLAEGERRWLLVLDNIGSAEDLEPLLPRGGDGRVLVTSRDRALSQFGPVLAVDVFDEDTATAFLVKRAGRPDDEPAARKLAAALGRLPLALSHAAAYCATGTSFTDYLELLGELPAVELFDTLPELSYARTVATTWKPSIAAASKAAPLATDVLEMASYLAPDAIPRSLFAGLIDDETPAQRRRLTLAFNALARFSLAAVDDDTISVHRLLQRTVRDDATAREDGQPALQALAALERRFPTDLESPNRWPTCELLLPHALALADALREPGDAGVALIRLLNRLSSYLIRAVPGPRGVPIAVANLTHAERVLGAEHSYALNSREHLAIALRNAGRTIGAIAICESLLADRERILGTEHPHTLITRHNLAVAYQDVARTTDAIAIYEPLLTHRERILGIEHPDTLTTRNNLANAYRAAGRTTDAIAMHELLLTDRERILSANHPESLGTRNNLAAAYQHAKRITDAIAIYEPLLTDSEGILGPEHPHTLGTRNNLAEAYDAVGRATDAARLRSPPDGT